MTTPGRPRNLKDLDGVPWRRLHLWQIQPIRDLLLLAAVFGLLYLGYKIQLVTVPLLLALLLAYLFEPIVSWLTRKVTWMTRGMAAGGLIAATLIVVIVPLSIAAAWGVAEGTQFAMRQANNAAHFVGFVRGTFPGTTEPEGEKNKNGDTAQPTGQTPPGTPPPEAEDDGIGVQPTDTEAAKDESSQDDQQKAEDPEDESLDLDSLISAAASPNADKASNGQRDKDDKLTPDEHRQEFTSEAWRWAADVLEDKKDNESAKKVAALIGTMNPVPTMSQVRAYLTGLVSGIAASLSLIGLFGFQLFLTAFFFYFISSEFGRVIDFIENLLPEKKRDRIVHLAQKMDKVIAGFVRGRLVIALIQGAIFSVAYLLMGVPAAILLGFAVGVLSVVPYLALIGIPISMLLLFLDGPDSGFRSAWWFMLFAPVVVYFILQALDDYVWTPMIQGKQTNLDTPTVLFASIAGGALAGFYGLLIAIPVAACLKILVQEVVWPRFKAWREGKVEDPLPLGGGE